MGLKQLIPGAGSGGGSGEGPTDEQLAQIGGVANDAKTLAQAAKTTADGAKSTADAAKASADGYAGQITAATTKADNAKAAAAAATEAAATAGSKADGVVATAAAASAAASAAGQKADAAKTTADGAKATADGLANQVTAASNKADAAKTTAETAEAAVAGAVTKADTAKVAADEAKAAVDGMGARLSGIEATAGGWSATIAEASGNANAANLAAQSAKDQVESLDTAITAIGTKADNAKASADAATTAASNAGTKAQQALDASSGLDADITAAQSAADEAKSVADSALLAAQGASGDLVNLQNDIGTAQEGIETNSFDITDLKTRMTAAETDIDALQAGGGGGGGSGLPRALKTIALYGDSLSGNNSDLGRMYTRGFLTFAQQMSGHRLYFDHSYNFGVGGEDSAAIAARVATVIAKAPDVVLLEMGGNDINRNITADTTIGYIKSTVEALIAAGIRVILCTIYPTAGTTNPDHFAAVAKINQWVLEANSRYELVEVLDAYDVIFNNDTGLVKPLYTVDTTHPGGLGSYHLGRKLAKIINELVPIDRHIRLTNPYDKWSLAAAKNGNIFTNPKMTGSGGTIVGTGGSGTIPDNFQLIMTNARAATVAVAPVGPTDNGFQTIELTLGGTTTSGTATYTNNSHIWLCEVLGGTTAWNTTELGTFLRDTATFKTITLECEVENLVGVTAVGAEIFHLSTGGDKPSNGDGLLTVNTTNPSTGAGSLAYPTEAAVQKLTLHCEPEVHTGKSNGYRIGLHIALLPGVAVSGKIRISRPVFRAYETKPFHA